MDDTHGFEGVSPAVLAQWQALAPTKRPGPNWLTSAELGQIWGLDRRRAYDRAEHLVNEGKAERDVGDQRTYYRIKEST